MSNDIKRQFIVTMNLQKHLAKERSVFTDKYRDYLERAYEEIPDDNLGDNMDKHIAASQARTIAFIREMVEGMRKPIKDWTKDEHGKVCVDGCTYCYNAQGNTDGFNHALDAVLEKLK